VETDVKIRILKSLDTRSLVEQVHRYEDELETALREQASFKSLNYQYLASRDGDCPEVKRLLSELISGVPERNDVGKKLTAAEKEAWLQRQRKENEELAAAITRQKDVAFLIDNHEIKVEMAKKRLEGARVVLGLKTAQINFLSG